MWKAVCWRGFIYLPFDLVQKFIEAGPLPSFLRRTQMTSLRKFHLRKKGFPKQEIVLKLSHITFLVENCC